MKKAILISLGLVVVLAIIFIKCRYTVSMEVAEYDYHSGRYSSTTEEKTVWALTDSSAFTQALNIFWGKKAVSVIVVKRMKEEGLKPHPDIPENVTVLSCFGKELRCNLSYETISKIEENNKYLIGNDDESLMLWDNIYMLKR